MHLTAERKNRISLLKIHRHERVKWNGDLDLTLSCSRKGASQDVHKDMIIANSRGQKKDF